MNVIKLITLLLLLPLVCLAQTGSTQAFQPVGFDYAITVGTSCTPAQIPAIGAPVNAPLVSLMLTNTGATVAYVAVGPTQASVTSPTVATGGSGILGAAANTTPVLSNGVVFTAPDASWICVVTASGSTTVHVQAGRGQ